MAKGKLKAQAFIKISDDESILWYEVLEGGEVIFYLSEEESEMYRKKMMENVGKSMSQYLQNHPESALWGATN